VFVGERVHGDARRCRSWPRETTNGRVNLRQVRDDRPFGGPDPPAAVFFYSPDRRGEHPEGHLDGFAGILHADAYGGFNRLYTPDRHPGPVLEAACWAPARPKFFVLAEIGLNTRGKIAIAAPLAVEAVKRIETLFDAERLINGPSTHEIARCDLSDLGHQEIECLRRPRKQGIAIWDNFSATGALMAPTLSHPIHG
jgi:transposase